MAYALPAIGLVAVAAAVTQGVELGLGRWVELTLLLWLATAPFAALGVLIGMTVANAEPAQSAASAAMIVLWVLGGMLTSPSDLPGALEDRPHAAYERGGGVGLGGSARRRNSRLGDRGRDHLDRCAGGARSARLATLRRRALSALR
jgi:hypothetical protein